MDRNMTTISLEVPNDMKEEIQTAIKRLFFHNNSELVRTGIRKVLDEIKMKKQVVEQTGNVR
jgi:Arc/MetJ-type ribon-helix-helix transcriptional regulator